MDLLPILITSSMQTKKIIVQNLPCRIYTSTEFDPDNESRTLVVFLHGRWDTWKTRTWIIQNMPENYQWLAVDFPWFWWSSKPDNSWNVWSYASWLQELLDKIWISSVSIFVGHSFWCRVLIAWVTRWVLKTQKLVFIWAWGIQENNKKWYFPILTLWKKILSRIWAKRVLQWGQRKLRSDDYSNAGSLEHIFLNTIGEDLTPLLSEIQQPTTLIWGKKDTQTPLRHGLLMKEKISQSTLHIFPEWTHFVHQEYADEIVDFISI